MKNERRTAGMTRTPGSWLIGEYNRWEIKFKVANGSVITEHSVIRLGTQAQAEKEYHSLSTDIGKAKLLKKAKITGLLVEVGDLLRHRGMSERIRVREPKGAKSSS
jgi:hypothetical protein